MSNAPLARTTTLLVAAAIAALPLVAPSPLSAQPSPTPAASSAAAPSKEDISRAKVLFQEGLDLQAKSDWAGAIAKFQAAGAIKMTPHMRFNIGYCEAHLGKLASAAESYRKAQADAEKANVTEVVESAKNELAAIEPRVPHLVVKAPAGMTVQIDGTPAGEARVDKALDPGPHTVEVFHNGQSHLKRTVQLAEGKREEIDVPPPAAPQPSASAAPTTQPSSKGLSQKTVGFIVAGAGLASLTTSVVFWVLRGNTIDDLDKQCSDKRCPPSAQSTIDKGKLFTGVSEATFVLGLAGLGVGGYLIFKPEPKSNAALRSIGVAAVPSYDGGSLRIQGAF